jgi:hypothetical protein
MENDQLLKEPSSPTLKQDNQKFCTFMFYMHGIGMLLPYNAIFATMDYFKKCFPKEENYHPDFTIVVAVSVSMLFSQVMSILLLEMIPIRLRLGLTFLFNTIFTASIAIVPHLLKKEISYVLLLCLCSMYGFSLALLQLTLYGEAGKSMKYTTAFMVGNGLSSLLINCLRILLMCFSLTSFNTIIFFGIATVFLGYCSYLALKYSSIKYKENILTIQEASNSVRSSVYIDT